VKRRRLVLEKSWLTTPQNALVSLHRNEKAALTPLSYVNSIFQRPSAKLGSDDDPIRQMLFANQPLKELVKRTTLDGSTNNPFQTITEASKLAEEGKKTDAVSKLRSVLQTQPPETRVELFVWSGLRELGESRIQNREPKFLA